MRNGPFSGKAVEASVTLRTIQDNQSIELFNKNIEPERARFALRFARDDTKESPKV